MEEVKNNVMEEAANAAGVKPAEAQAEAQKPATEVAKDPLKEALDKSEGARSRQKALFGHHFSGSQDIKVLKAVAERRLKAMVQVKANLEALIQAVDQKLATDYFNEVAANAANLTPEALDKAIQALQAQKEELAKKAE